MDNQRGKRTWFYRLQLLNLEQQATVQHSSNLKRAGSFQAEELPGEFYQTDMIAATAFCVVQIDNYSLGFKQVQMWVLFDN